MSRGDESRRRTNFVRASILSARLPGNASTQQRERSLRIPRQIPSPDGSWQVHVMADVPGTSRPGPSSLLTSLIIKWIVGGCSLLACDSVARDGFRLLEIPRIPLGGV